MTVTGGYLYIARLSGQQGLQWWDPQHSNQHVIQRVLKQLPNPSVQEAIDPEAQSFCDRALLANYHSFSLRSRLLIKQTSMAECNSFQRSQRVGAIFTLSLFCIPEHLYILEGRSFMFLVPLVLYLVPWFLQVSPRGGPLIAWLWWPGRACVPVLNNQRDSSWQAFTHRTLHRYHTKIHPQSFCEWGLYACPGSLVWGASFRSGTQIGAYGYACRERRLVDVILVLSLCLIIAYQYLSEKSFIHLSGVPNIVTATRG